MFGPSKVSKSLIDAVSKIMEDKSVEETQPTQVEEAAEKVVTPTGMKVYGSSYGNSAKARRDQTKSSVDDVKEPTKKDIEKDSAHYVKDTGQKRNYKVHAGRYFSNTEKGLPSKGKEEPRYKNEEVKHDDEKEDKALIKKMVDKSCLKKEEDETVTLSFKDRLIGRLQEAKSSGTEEIFTDNNLGEEEMTDKQKAKREKIVMSMKKGEAGFKQRYGKNWKNVIYATATKQAMKEEMVAEEDLDESDDVINKQRKDDMTKAMKHMGLNGRQIKYRHKQMDDAGKAAAGKKQNEEVELDEATPAKNTDVADKSYLKHKPGTVKGQLTQIGRFLRGKPEIKEDVEVQVDKAGDKITTDMLSGRVKGGKVNSFKNYKVDLKSSGEEPVPKSVDKGEDTREKQKITTNPGPVDVKFDDKLGHPTPQSHFSNEHQITHESVQMDEKVIAGTPGWEKVKGADTKGNVKDKSGAVHTPMSRARDLARKSFAKLKNETMMGKISN
jgi:hypothetical protein